MPMHYDQQQEEYFRKQRAEHLYQCVDDEEPPFVHPPYVDHITEVIRPMERPPSLLPKECNNLRLIANHIKNLLAMPGMITLDSIDIVAMGEVPEVPGKWIVNYTLFKEQNVHVLHFPIASLERVYKLKYKMYYDAERDQSIVQVYDEKYKTRRELNSYEMNTLTLYAKNNGFKVTFVARDNPDTGQSDWGGKCPIQHAFFPGNMWG